jgi:hypothetical protein
MVQIWALWLPVVLSAVVVFFASSILHMVLTYHRSDYKQLPDEGNVMEAMRKARVAPGDYHFPYATSMKDLGLPEMMEKFQQGPVGTMSVRPSGPPTMGKALTQWFIYCLVISFFLAYVASRTLDPGAHYLAVFRVVGTVGFMAYAAGTASESIWTGRAWSTTLKNVFDGLVYALLTAGVFGWLWPAA